MEASQSDQPVNSGTSSQYSGRSTRGNLNVILEMECVTSLWLKRFLLLQFLLRWLSIGIWIFFAVLAYQVSFYVQREKQNLHLATALSAGFLGVVCVAQTRLLCGAWKTFKDQQHWTLQRRRLVGITLVQLTALVVSCQLLMTHTACVWTDGNAKPQRQLFAHLLPGMAEKPRNRLILEGPWLIHLPKLLLWGIAEATIILQLVISLRGHAYYPVLPGYCASPLRPCQRTVGSLVAIVVRTAVYGVYIIWHFVLVFQGSRDMARMPLNTFRTGRMLIRMACSRDLGIGSNFVPYSTLVICTVTEYYICVSCQPNYTLLGLIVQCSVLMSMGSILVCPKRHSTDNDILMQAWLQRFAWTEKKLERRKEARDSLPADKTLLNREPMFCFETAVKLLYWCGFVYEHGEGNPVVGIERGSQEVAMGLYNLQHLELLRDPVTSTKCLVAWGRDTCVVAFRGTANKQNAMHDVKAWLVPHIAEQNEAMSCGLGAAAAVHSGFSASWQSGLKQAVCKILQQVVHNRADKACNMRMLITGHSLGGVMALLAAYDIADLYPWQSMQVYTVGAPRPGNKAFAAKYEAKVPATWHIINPKCMWQDPVPRVGKLGVLYTRPGQRVLVDKGGDMQVRPTPLDIRLSSSNPVRQMLDEVIGFRQLMTLWGDVKSHRLASYRTCFVNILKAELRQPRFEEGLHDVLDLANSLSLTEILQAADLDITAQGKAVSKAEAGVQAAQSLVVDSTNVV